MFKQATAGDVAEAKNPYNKWLNPPRFYQWAKWNEHKGKSSEDAQGEYIKLAGEMKTKYGMK